MRLILTYLLILLFTIESYSQEDIIDPIETQAEFPGGIDSMWCFVESNLDFEILNSSNEEGRVFLSFVIDTAGAIKDIECNPDYVLRLSNILQDTIIEIECKRVISGMPTWNPAMQGNTKVKMLFTMILEIPYENYRCTYHMGDGFL